MKLLLDSYFISLQGYFSFVEANVTIYVRSVTVRGTSVKSPSELSKTMWFSSVDSFIWHVLQPLWSSN